MSRRYVLTADRASCDTNWMLKDMHEIRGLDLADLVLVWLIYRATGIPFRVSIDRGPDSEGVAA